MRSISYPVARHITRALALATAALVAAACHNAQPQPSAPASGPSTVPETTTPSPTEVSFERRVERISRAMLDAEPRTRQDSNRLAAFRRADSTAALVDSLIVTPASIRLRVGDSLTIMAMVHVDARDRAGAPVLRVAPMFSVEPRTIARLRGSYLVALATGQATLLVKTVRLVRSSSPAWKSVLTRVPVQVVDP